MKKFFTLIIIGLLTVNYTSAAIDRCSQEYLQNKKHFSIMKRLTENIARKGIKAALQKETGVNFDVTFEGYTAYSIKKGVFKNLELTGENANISGITIPKVHLKSLNEYNYIDYTQKPVVYKTDMDFAYDLILSEESINQALESSKYKKNLDKINNVIGFVFVIKKVRTKIVDNKLYLIMHYNLPIIKTSKDRSFVTSSDFQVVDGKIKAKNVRIDSIYGNLELNKVANLVNLLNPLEFTLNSIDNNKYKGNIENVNIIDNKIKIDGKIFLKANG